MWFFGENYTKHSLFTKLFRETVETLAKPCLGVTGIMRPCHHHTEIYKTTSKPPTRPSFQRADVPVFK